MEHVDDQRGGPREPAGAIALAAEGVEVLAEPGLADQPEHAGAQLARLLVRYERPLQLIMGAALLAVGIWDLTLNLPLILG